MKHVLPSYHAERFNRWQSWGEWRGAVGSSLDIWCLSEHLSRPTTMMDSCPHHDTVVTKTADLLHAVWSMTFPTGRYTVCFNHFWFWPFLRTRNWGFGLQCHITSWCMYFSEGCGVWVFRGVGGSCVCSFVVVVFVCLLVLLSFVGGGV